MNPTPLRLVIALLFATLPLLAEIEQGLVEVVQLNDGHNSTSLRISLSGSTSPRVHYDQARSNRGDYTLDFSHADDIATGVLMSTVAENGRDNSDEGGPEGTKYAVSSIEENLTEYFIAVHQTSGAEFNIDCSFAHFPFADWLGGVAQNSSDNGPITSFRGSAGINLGTEFVDNGNGTFTLDLTLLGGDSGDGILLVNGARNEENYALSGANADGTFTLYIHDSGTNASTFERDPIAFVYIPKLHGSDQIVAMARINGSGSADIEEGNYSLSQGAAGTGTWFLTIPGHSPDTGNLLLSPEAGNTDNIYSHQWDPLTSRWVIQSRDLPAAGLQDVSPLADAFSFAFLTTPASTVFVDASATGANDGRSWVNAFTELSSAFAIANPGDTVLVAEGIYTPGASRGDSFVLLDGMEVYGGFRSGGSSLTFRDPAAHPTILSGDLTGDDSQSPVATNALELTGQTNNSNNIVTGNNLAGGTVLDGFTITAGYASGSSANLLNRGGGMRLVGSSPQLSNLVFSGCTAEAFGGGLYNLTGSPVLRDVSFIGNHASRNGGGGLWSDGAGGGSIITNARFINNSSLQFNGGGAGAFLNDFSVITNALFVGNTALGSSAHGGAVRIKDGAPTLVNLTIAGNHGTNGGGIGIEGSAIPILHNCLIWENTATNGPGVFGAIDPASSNNLIQGEPGASDPLFVRNPDSGDGTWMTTADNDYGDLQLQGASPAIDTGDNGSNPEPLDLDGADRIVRATIDIGALEAQSPPWLVDASATGGANNGLTWADAFTDLQSALAADVDGGQIWVAEGTYKPTATTSQAISFDVTSEIGLYGGFPSGGSSFAARDRAAHPTILSGEINGDGASNNSQHVMRIFPNLTSCLIDGVTISDGYADGPDNQGRGGGIFINEHASPTFREVLLSNNHAVNDGGAVMIETGGSVLPIFESVRFRSNDSGDDGGAVYSWNRSAEYRNCTFEQNSAGGEGGGLFNDDALAALVTDCTFLRNSATNGGAVSNFASPVNFVNCTFQENETVGIGTAGAIYNNANSDATITSCKFLGNRTNNAGGAIRNRDDSDVTIVNSLFVGNVANLGNVMQGGAIQNGVAGSCDLLVINCSFLHNEAGSGAAIYATETSPVVHNSIIWNNSPDEITGSVPLSPISSNNLLLGVGGATDPLLVKNPNPGDGDWTTTADNDYGDLRLTTNSPAIGQGENSLVPAGITTDLDGAPRIQPHDVDQGAYESSRMNVELDDVPVFAPHGEETVIPGWAPDGTAYNGGSGFTYQFTLLGTTGNLTFDVLPMVDPDGTLRFTASDLTGGSATFEVSVSDPVGLYLPPAPQNVTLTTGEVRRVDAGVVGGSNDGSSWENAFQSLEAALAAATPGDELWVAQGTYETTSSFSVNGEVAILGGFFPGGGDGTFSQRVADPATTILSGGATPETAGNADHVLFVEPDLYRVFLERLTLVNGFADGAGDDAKGAAVFVSSNSTLFLTDVVVADNRASGKGGAIYFESGGLGNPIFERVSFNNNQSGDFGGAVHLPFPRGERRPEVRDCHFIGNNAAVDGGALYGSPGSVVGCLFQDNYATEYGGAVAHREGVMEVLASSFVGNSTLEDQGEIRNGGGALFVSSTEGTQADLTLCLFEDNISGFEGGAVASSGNTDIVNCRFTNNRSWLGGAFYGRAGRIEHSTFYNNPGHAIFLEEGVTLLRHSIVWNGNHPDVEDQPIGIRATASLAALSKLNIVQNGLTLNEENAGRRPVISQSDPLFVDAEFGDFRLQRGSPAINRGDKTLLPSDLTTDLNGDPRLVPFQLDLGAYEFQDGVLPSQNKLNVAYTERLEAGSHSVECWAPGHGLSFDFEVVATSGTLSFDAPPVVLPDGTLQFSLAEQPYGRAIIEAVATGPGMTPLSFQFSINAPSLGAELEYDEDELVQGLENILVTDSFSYVASRSLSIDPSLKVARVRAYQHPPGVRKGIAIVPNGFSTAVTEYEDDPSGEIGKYPLSGVKKRAFEAGFDVYHIVWNDPRTWIEDHAMIIADFLAGLVDTGFPGPGHPSGHNDLLLPGEKVAVLGGSMGGLISRTALCYLDHHAIPYQCDLFLSMDAPQEGAYIPIGLQEMGLYLASVPEKYIDEEQLEGLTALNEALDQPAPREMLVVHNSRSRGASTPSHAPERDDFVTLLDSFGTWPTNPGMRMAAIASGRGDGLFEDPGKGKKDDLREYTGPGNPNSFVMLEWESKVSKNALEIDIPAICIISGGKVDETGSIDVQLLMSAFGVNPSSPGTAGQSQVFRGDAVATLKLKGANRDIDLTITDRDELIEHIRDKILALVAPNGIFFPCQQGTESLPGVYPQIESKIEASVDDLLALRALLKESNTRHAYTTQHWDWLPGGQRDTGSSAANDLGGAGEVIHFSARHCFIPTTSALGLSTVISPQGVAIPPNAAALSPFDEVYHFGTHTNTSHLRNDKGIDHWLSEIVSHELSIICGEFTPQLDQVPTAVHWRGLRTLEEFDVSSESWIHRSDQRDGIHLLPDPAPDTGFFRLRFPTIYPSEP